MLSRAQKEQQVAELREKFARATCVYVADYRGIGVQSANQLRRRIRKEGDGDYEYRVAKNSVVRRAVTDTPVAELAESFAGPTAVAISYGDSVGLAKILVDFAKDHEVFELRAGLLDGRAIDASEIGTLATLPSLDELRAMLLGLVQAPATKLVRLVSEPGAQIARVLSARGSEED
ncbi:MAG: 50S ribosomal protein L10 [Myxococcota bacterium]|nr:50S ribosomal protein L10 [bacterium]MDP6242295.1 50S ribosomal protein L10 [Myxococcota bacterium]MDP7075855.1 50S ribosomal protein L10 [Myxococcota bacterium]MDP7299740.1 50S ribosomal protein L10 [Myxococcota bacterium]MDP7433735.1 50S ribosomal protein L10 [Myxococcota bacterium]